MVIPFTLSVVITIDNLNIEYIAIISDYTIHNPRRSEMRKRVQPTDTGLMPHKGILPKGVFFVKAEQPAAGAIAEEAPVAEAPVAEAPVAEPVAEEVVAEEKPKRKKKADDTTEEAPIEEVSAEEALVEEAPAEEA